MDNTSLFFLIFSLSQKWTILDRFMIFATDYLLYLSLFWILFLAVKGKIKEKKAFLLIILAIPLAILLIKFIHLFIIIPRPFVTFNFQPLTDSNPDASFPSRHATIMAVVAFALTFLKSNWAPLFFLLMILVGVSRIYIGVHYPLDVLGGFITGLISLILALLVKKLLKISLFS